ncbi:16S rRNA (guanine(527)-N(7))-methyltransferase RsmG [Tropicibacter sp. S64]|uniref:16S rRNA (guanine(527)-N(7))-methyltransferase RsmG n=1 Tax=Tropicibacter sp. S64 TaxID=3415122 RepID=UPI003C7A0071
MSKTLSVSGIHVSRETMDRLELYRDLLRHWNPKINLVSPGTLSDAWTRHMEDSAQILAHASGSPTTWTDLGSGGGFPGMVIAIIMAETSPSTKVKLIESDIRKCTFLRTVAREAGIRPDIQTKRIEAAVPSNADVVTARALAPLNTLLGYVSRHLATTGRAYLPKGENWQAEVQTAQESWHFTLITHKSKTNPNAVVLEIGEIIHV